MINAKSAWVDGALQPFDQCNLHITTFALHYGVGVFEGIRSYKRADGTSGVFRLSEHVQRLFHSARLFGMAIPYTPGQIEAACLTVLRDNQLDEAYLRPLVFTGAGALGLGATGNPTSVVIFAWPWQTPLGTAGQQDGIRAQVSSFIRPHPNSVMSKAKVTGQYALSVLAKREAARLGFDEAIMLDASGRVAEGTAQNIFAVFDGQLHTPPLDLPILAGITRDAVIELAKRASLPVVQRAFSRDTLYQADEAFLTGTAVEITPIREIDGLAVGNGKPGPLTASLQAAFAKVTRSASLSPEPWMTPV